MDKTQPLPQITIQMTGKKVKPPEEEQQHVFDFRIADGSLEAFIRDDTTGQDIWWEIINNAQLNVHRHSLVVLRDSLFETRGPGFSDSLSGQIQSQGTAEDVE